MDKEKFEVVGPFKILKPGLGVNIFHDVYITCDEDTWIVDGCTRDWFNANKQHIEVVTKEELGNQSVAVDVHVLAPLNEDSTRTALMFLALGKLLNQTQTCFCGNCK